MILGGPIGVSAGFGVFGFGAKIPNSFGVAGVLGSG